MVEKVTEEEKGIIAEVKAIGKRSLIALDFVK